MKWYRGPKGRGVMITSLRDGLNRLPDVVRERRVLESLELGHVNRYGFLLIDPAWLDGVLHRIRADGALADPDQGGLV